MWTTIVTFTDAINAVDPEIPCVAFENGDELLNYLENSSQPPDYIFIDINMPKINGYECAPEIKSIYHSADTQIVMYSTAVNPLDLVKFDRQGLSML